MFFWREQIGAQSSPERDRRSSVAHPRPTVGDDVGSSGCDINWGFTHAGPSSDSGEFGGANLARHVGDDPSAVEANRVALARTIGVDRDHLMFMSQVHGTDVVTVDGPWRADPPQADALVSASPDVALAVLVADCVPVLLADVGAGVIGAVHAGRPGMVGGIVEASVTAMRELGANDIRAAVGPSVCARCYEVPEQMRAAAAAVSPVSAAVSWTGTPAIDVAAGVVDQLGTLGVSRVDWVPGCTRESPRLYSYRRRRRTGRFAGVVRRSSS